MALNLQKAWARYSLLPSNIVKTRVLRILKVDVVLLINKVFQRIGIEHFDVNKLLELCKDNDSVWSLYANGYTIGMNQVEQDGSRMKCMKYKPHNISELSAFVAAIRPGFKSMYKRFEEREDFSYGINALDNLVRTEELPVSFLFYQEQVMSVLHYAGFPMDQCYGIIKAIAKKHPEKVLPLKSQFLEGFKNQIIQDEKLDEAKAERYSADVWKIVNDNVNYSFNCVSGKTRIIGDSDLTVEEMYLKHHENHDYGYALSLFDDKKLRKNKIIGIYEAGKRQTYKIETESGAYLICTNNHRFPTPEGKKRLDELKIGDFLYCKCENSYSVFESPVKSIEIYDVEMTYDIEMANPAHTFVSESGLVTSNSAHAYCVALDSLYQAWQKATYPFEFYEVLLQHYSDKGKKDKVSKLKKEMKVAFGIKEGEYKFRNDNRTFVSDKENMVIYPSLGSIKNITQRCADTIYKLKDNTYKNFVELLYDMKKAGLTQRQVLILIRIDYFSEFGSPGKLIKIQELFEKLNENVQLKKDKVDSLSIPHEIVEYYSGKVTEKQYNGVDVKGLLTHWADIMPFKNVDKIQLASWRYKYIGFCDIVDHDLKGCVLVTNVNTRYSPRITVYALANGNTLDIKIQRKVFNEKPIEDGDILAIYEYEHKQKTRMNEEGKYERIPDEYEWWIKKYDVKLRMEK